MRNAFANALYEVAKSDPRIYVVVADISPAGALDRFRHEFPERFINVGVAEQAMIGIAAGLALRGCKPFCYTIAPFALYRPFEFVRDDLCYQNLPVTVVGMGTGVIYSTLGGTHHTIEDIAIATALPNLQVIAPSDPNEVIAAVRYCAQAQSPIYLRIGKAGELNYGWQGDWEFGKLHWLKQGKEACILSYGGVMRKAHAVMQGLEEKGVSVSLASCHTLKPLDAGGIVTALLEHGSVLVIEEHVYQGGLAMRVKELACNTRQLVEMEGNTEIRVAKVRHATLKDKFVHQYGSHDDLLQAHEML